MATHEFGGGWTEEKLQILDHYLTAYCKIFQTNPRAKHLNTIYVDAFAGTGLIQQRTKRERAGELFAEFAEPEMMVIPQRSLRLSQCSCSGPAGAARKRGIKSEHLGIGNSGISFVEDCTDPMGRRGSSAQPLGKFTRLG